MVAPVRFGVGDAKGPGLGLSLHIEINGDAGLAIVGASGAALVPQSLGGSRLVTHGQGSIDYTLNLLHWLKAGSRGVAHRHGIA